MDVTTKDLTASPTEQSVPPTPLPWFVGTQNDGLFILDTAPRPSNDYPNPDARVAAIANVYHGNHGAANAAFIVRACNGHQALVAALTQIANEMQAASSRGRDVSVEWLDLRIATARAALAHAEGR